MFVTATHGHEPMQFTSDSCVSHGRVVAHLGAVFFSLEVDEAQQLVEHLIRGIATVQAERQAASLAATMGE